jgi:Domain of unknown function (DUF4266)
MKNTSRWVLLAALGAAAAAMTGCANTNLARVKPWERGVLADETMNPNRDSLNTEFIQHVYFSREAASGGAGVGGAGCGCN